MARTTTTIQADIDALRKAIGSGAKRVEFGSGTTRHVTEFRSLAEMRGALADLEAELTTAAGTAPVSRISYVEHGRDL